MATIVVLGYSCVNLAAVPLKVTAVADWRFIPVILTSAPTLAPAGENDVIWGGAGVPVRLKLLNVVGSPNPPPLVFG